MCLGLICGGVYYQDKNCIMRGPRVLPGLIKGRDKLHNWPINYCGPVLDQEKLKVNFEYFFGHLKGYSSQNIWNDITTDLLNLFFGI